MVHGRIVLTLQMMLFLVRRTFTGVALSIIGLTLVDLASHPERGSFLRYLWQMDIQVVSKQFATTEGTRTSQGVAPTTVSYTLNSASIWLPGAFVPQPSFCIL